jgi:hypothetical protein
LIIINELQTYQNTLDPELCDDLMQKIIDLDEECQIDIEPIDCG